MFVECPHCHTSVLPLENNICPACRKDMSDTRGVDTRLASLLVRESTKLPPYCYSCNSPTKHYVLIKEKVTIGGDTPLEKFLIVLVGIITLRIWRIKGWKNEGETSSVVVSIPQCEQCARLGKPKPDHVDFEEQSMTFIVHKGFRDRVHQIQDGIV